MKRSNAQQLSEVIKEYLREMNMDRKLKEVDLVQSWEELVGKPIARYTRNIYLSNGILFIDISSAVVKNELIILREEIRHRLNELAGEEMVVRIVFK